MKRFALLAAVVGLLSSYATPSLAATVDYVDESVAIVQMGTTPLVAGYEGDVGSSKSNSSKGFSFYDLASFSLAAQTSILFTYTLAETPTDLRYAITPRGESSGSYDIEGYASTSVANQFFINIANLTSGALDFTIGLKLKGITDIASVATTYATSPVPLPAALPLFGLGLVGLAGYRRMKKGSVEA